MRTTWDEGTTADLAVTVEGGQLGTEVTLRLRAPDGTESAVAMTSGADRTEWHGYPVLPQPGVWWATVTVTGPGAGVKSYRLQVAPTSPVPAAGRVYATSADLARWMQAAPPIDSDRLLARASSVVDELSLLARYAVDDDGYPTVERVIEGLRDATCAQAAFLHRNYGGLGGYNSVKIGSVSLTGTPANTEPAGLTPDGTPVAPETLAELRRAGVVPGHVVVCG